MSDTKAHLLDLAETMTQTRGFRGFSYIDLAKETGMKTASVHNHFKTKDALASALVLRTHDRHMAAFAQLEVDHRSPRKRLGAIIDYFEGYLDSGRFCLCGMMAAELESVSDEVAVLLQQYFAAFEGWLTRQFKLIGTPDPKAQALRFLSTLEGALLLGRLRQDSAGFRRSLKAYVTN